MTSSGASSTSCVERVNRRTFAQKQPSVQKPVRETQHGVQAPVYVNGGTTSARAFSYRCVGGC